MRHHEGMNVYSEALGDYPIAVGKGGFYAGTWSTMIGYRQVEPPLVAALVKYIHSEFIVYSFGIHHRLFSWTNREPNREEAAIKAQP